MRTDFDKRRLAGNGNYIDEPVEITVSALLGYSFDEVVRLRKNGNIGLTVNAGGSLYSLYPKDIEVEITDSDIIARFVCTGVHKIKAQLKIEKHFTSL